MKRRLLTAFGILAVGASVATASFVAAFGPDKVGLKPTAATNVAEAALSAKGQKKDGLASEADFKGWLSGYTGVNKAEKELVYGMLADDYASADRHFDTSCKQGDERGCFQSAMLRMSKSDPRGLDTLRELALNAKHPEVSSKSAKLLGAYILDFAPDNRSAVTQTIEALVPHAAAGDPDAQFMAAHLFLANGIYNEADKMLTSACVNERASSKIVEYCTSGAGVEAIDSDGIVIASAKSETACASR